MAPHRRKASSAIVLLAASAVFASAACSGTGGCSALAPIPGGRYQGPKMANAVNMRLSSNGLAYVNQNWAKVLEIFVPDLTVVVPISCTTVNVPVFGAVRVADQGSANGGRMDGRCDGNDEPALVPVRFTGFSIRPSQSLENALDGEITIEVATGDIFASSANRRPPVCLFLGALSCAIDFNTGRANNPSNTVRATIAFTIDARWGELLAFDFASIDGISVDPADLNIRGTNGCGNFYCSILDFDLLKNFLVQQLEPTVRNTVTAALRRQSCEPCGAGCPTAPDGTPSSCSTDGVCVDEASGRCVPRFLGLEGRLAMGSLLSGFGVPAEAQLDVTVAAGGSVSVDSGLDVGTVAGVRSVEAAACAPAMPPPQLGPAPVPNFDAEAPTNPDGSPKPYHVAIGLSHAFLSLGMYHAHQSGSLCPTLSTSTIGPLHTGLFKTFLPSLGPLATRDGKDAPMMVVLRPAQVPQLSIGTGTFDLRTRRPIEPLLTLEIPELALDVYALIDDRFARLFSITADVRIPLSLAFESCSSVVPVLGDLRQLATNFRIADSEMLAEDPAFLADLVPALIGLAEPALAAALQRFELPELAGFKLQVLEDGAKGLSIIPDTRRYQHVGIYANLADAAAPCARTSALVTQVAVDEVRVPSASSMRLVGKPLPWPEAVLKVETFGEEGTAEYSVRVDGGLWTTFTRPEHPRRLEVSHPAFLVQGRHAIEVRSRFAEDPQGISPPVRVDFLVDWDPPEVALGVDDLLGVLEVRARDAVSDAAALTYAYRFGDASASDFGISRRLTLDEVEQRGGVEVLVRDEAGNVASARWNVLTTASRDQGENRSLSREAAGCTATGSVSTVAALVAAAGWVWGRRRRR